MTKFASLFALYFAQGLPFGFQATAMPLLLRERGVSLEAIGFLSLLAAPWLAKPLWAPLVDRYGNKRLGRRKSWILPMQAGLVAAAVLAAHTDDLTTLALIVLVMNLFAATQDIAVDALAVSWLGPEQLGFGNAMQVIGYKLGMLTGGGLLVWASARIGWSGSFSAMAVLMLLVLLASVAMPERRAQGPEETSEPVRFRELRRRLSSAWREPATAALIVVVLTYKLGETLADVMWKPMLVDRGFPTADIGLWTGTFGMLCSLAGTTAAGALVRSMALPSALLWTSVARAVGVAGEWWLSVSPAAGAGSVIAVTCAEHFLGGAITTALFALMMRHTDRKIGATHYTLLASLEVWGKLPVSALSGVVAARGGYPLLFGTATLLCIAFALLVRALQSRLESAPVGLPARRHSAV